jgi:uncharacterized membrane protein
MDYDVVLILTTIVVGMSEIILGIPLLFEKIKPNWVYGFRLPNILSNEEIWYKSNKYVGRDFIVAGMIVIIGSLILFAVKSEFSILEITWTITLLLILPIIIVLIRGFNYLKKL